MKRAEHESPTLKRKTNAAGMKRRGGTAGLPHPGSDIASSLNALLTQRLEDSCERAWVDLAQAFGLATLFPAHDSASARARAAIRAVIADSARGLTRVALAALLLPPVTAWPRPRSTSKPPRGVVLPLARKRGSLASSLPSVARQALKGSRIRAQVGSWPVAKPAPAW